MTAAWPGTVPLTADSDAYGEQPERNVVSFTPEVGPPTERPRSTISSDLLSFSKVMTFTQYDTLIAFYRTDLKQGTQPFTRPHPRNVSGPSLTFKFTEVPKFSALGYVYGQVSMQMRKMP